LFELYQIM